MKMKKLVVALLAGALTVGSAMTASAAWVQSGSEWRFENEDGSWQAGKWFQDAGKWYHFDESGNMRKGWFKDVDSKWYFLAYHGAMQTGLIKVDDNVYFMNADGSLFVGTMKINGIDYDFTEYGTTNGKPSVGAAQTWGGNGNQTGVVLGRRSYSSGGGSGSGGNGPTVPAPGSKEAVENSVKDLVASEKEGNAFAEIDMVGNKITAKVDEAQSELALLEVLDDATSILDGVLNNTDGVKAVKVGTETLTSESTRDDLIKVAKKLGYSRDTELGTIKDQTIVIELDNNQTITYTFSVLSK